MLQEDPVWQLWKLNPRIDLRQRRLLHQSSQSQVARFCRNIYVFGLVKNYKNLLYVLSFSRCILTHPKILQITEAMLILPR